MADHVDSLLAEAVARLKQQEALVVDTKKFINQLLSFAKRDPMFPDAELGVAATLQIALKGDEYVGQKQQTATRMVLERRKALNLGPATQDELWADLVAGGYRSSAKTEAIAKQILQQMLSQNSSAFHRIPNGKWGLTEWYGDVKRRTKQGKAQGDDASDGKAINSDAKGETPVTTTEVDPES
jgi:hypothetical protein